MSTLQSFISLLNTSGFLHNAFVAPLLLVLADFVTGLGSAAKNQKLDPTKAMNIIGKDSDLLKYGVGALTLGIANNLHVLTPDLNSFFAGVGSMGLCVVILHSIFTNVVEMLPAGWQPAARVLEADIEAGVQNAFTHNQVPGQASSVAPVTPIPTGGFTVNTADIPLTVDNQATAAIAVPVEQVPVSVEAQPTQQFMMPTL